MDIKIVKNSVSRKELSKVAREQFGDFIKAVVDIEKGIMAIGGELHADEEVVLVEKERSKRENTWGINLYPEAPPEEFIEFDSMINLKPHLGNRSRGVEDSGVQEKIKETVNKLVNDRN